MFRVSGTVRKGSKTAIYRHHFLMQDSLLFQLSLQIFVKYLQYCATYIGLVQELDRGVMTHLAALVYRQLLGPLHTARIPTASHVSETLPSVILVPLATGIL